jgi:hypothetical protein
MHIRGHYRDAYPALPPGREGYIRVIEHCGRIQGNLNSARMMANAIRRMDASWETNVLSAIYLQ